MTDRFEVCLWGTRGSLPVSGPEFRKFGGNTSCVEMRCGDRVLLFDAGSGLPGAGQRLKTKAGGEVALFFTHFHYDHVMGLPFFAPFYDPAASVSIWSGNMAGKMTTHDVIRQFMQAPFFPIGPEVWHAQLTTHDFTAGDVLKPCPGVTLRTGALNHPGGAIGYRVEFGGRAVALITDTEHEPGVLDPAVLALIEGCDLFMYDATFTDAEFDTYRGFGHSTWQHAIRLAQAAGAKRVGFIHHAKWRNDADLSQIDAEAKLQMAGAFCGEDGQIITL